jgi:hypothetical protein
MGKGVFFSTKTTWRVPYVTFAAIQAIHGSGFVSLHQCEHQNQPTSIDAYSNRQWAYDKFATIILASRDLGH